MTDEYTYDDAMEALRRADAAGNVQDARRLAQIANSLKSKKPTLGGIAKYGGQGINTGMLGDIAGMPVDAATWALNKLVTGGQGKVIDRPVGGSEFLKGGLARAGLGYEQLEDVPEQYRPFAAGGETLGASVPFGAAPFAGIGPKLLTQAARQAPKATALAETSAAGASAVGGGLAEHYAPGDPGARMAGEIIGGFAGPAGIIPLGQVLARSLRQGVESFSPAARETRAAGTAQRIVQEAGEDPADVAARLGGEPSAPSVTSAQRAGSPGLSALETAVVGESRAAGGNIAAQTQAAVQEFNDAMRQAMATGDPQALRDVAVARERWWRGLIETRMTQAETKVAETMEGVRAVTPEARTDANLRARTIVDDAIGDGYKQQAELWGRIDRDAPINPSDTFGAHNAVRQEILPTEGLPPPIEAELARWRDVTGDGTKIPAWQVLRLRSRVLDHSRAAGKDANWSLKRQLDTLADGLLDDLEQIPGDAANEARAFSRALNDRSRRTWAKVATGRTREGGDVTPEQVTLERAYGGGGPEAAVRMEGLEEAVTPVPGGTAGYETAAAPRAGEMRAVQETYLRDVAGTLVDPASGRVNPARLAKWRADNRELLKRFPELNRDLRTAETAQRRIAEVAPIYERGRKVGLQRTAFAKIAKVEDPTVAFERALRGDNPQREVTDLFKLATRGGPQAQAGARAAFIDAAFNLGRTPQGMIEPVLFERLLLEGPFKEAALKTGVLTQQQADNLVSLAEEMRRFNTAVGSERRLDEILDPESAVFDLLARVTGANLGAATGQRAGASLVGAHAGSQRMRKLLNKMPRQKVIDILTEAIERPEIMARLLRKRTTKLDLDYAANALKTIIYRAGIERPAVASRLIEEEE